MTSIQCGDVEAVHEVTVANVHRQQLVEVARSDRHPDDGDPLHLPVQRALDHEPDPRDVHRARLLLQPLPQQAARARGRRGDHDPPDAARLQPGAPSELHRLLRAGARRHHRPARDVEDVGGALRLRRLVPPPLPHVLRLPRRAPVLHVVLGGPRDAPLRPGDHRRRRRQGRRPPRVHVGVDAQRRTGDGQRRGRPLRHDHPPAHPAADDRRRADERAQPYGPSIAHRGGCGRRHGWPGRPSRRWPQRDGAAAQRRLPVSPADRAARRRGAGRAAVARRRLRHGRGRAHRPPRPPAT